MFNRTTTVTPSATDGTNTYTCVTGGTASSNNWPYICYKTGATAATAQAVVTIGAADTTNVVGRAAQFYNISALDGQSNPVRGQLRLHRDVVASQRPQPMIWCLHCLSRVYASGHVICTGFRLHFLSE